MVSESAVRQWPEWLSGHAQLRHVVTRAARPGVVRDWPDWVRPEVRTALAARGVHRLWSHQVEAAEAAHGGRHVVLATGTASGKSLGYLLPILAATSGSEPSVHDRRLPSVRSLLSPGARPHTALYLAPTKALAHDQLRQAKALGLDGWRVGALDGDSNGGEHDFARDWAGFILSNPDMLHHSVLPQHARWASFLSTLRYVVIDESHRYRGVFGAHVAQVLRRLRRICASYGADPAFVFASATSSDPAAAAARLIGVSTADVDAVLNDGAPHGEVRYALWDGRADSVDATTALMGDLVEAGRQTVAFISSRKLCEVTAMRVRERTGIADVAAYRGGYLAAERRQVEAELSSGRLRGVAATNALELGVDIAGLDAVVITGVPGTMASFWQQAGRAGRRGKDAAVVLVAGANPRDAYVLDHPELIFERPVEQTVLHPDNPYVLGPHLAAAAQEIPLVVDDQQWFGPSMTAVADRLARQGALRKRTNGWYWTRPGRAVDLVNLRTQGNKGVQIVEDGTGRVIGHVDTAAADSAVHPGAVYLHRGETHLVDELDHEGGVALVHVANPGYVTQPRSVTSVEIRAERASRRLGAGMVHLGDVEVTSQVTGFLRRDERTGAVWDTNPLDLPVRRLRTRAVWWTLPSEVVSAAGFSPQLLGAAAHAAEHTAIGLLGLFAPCDRWDIGGLSTALHPQTDTVTVFVHDGHPGGAGFADRGYEAAPQWWAATLERLLTCPCEGGCPACVMSPKCGNGNQMLDKDAAIVLLRTLLPD
ncbi:DEAD/DEAH box helicase [Propionibacteriaceae bacterium Y1685]